MSARRPRVLNPPERIVVNRETGDFAILPDHRDALRIRAGEALYLRRRSGGDRPGHIYLRTGPIDGDVLFDELAEVTWCYDRINAADVAYVSGGGERR